MSELSESDMKAAADGLILAALALQAGVQPELAGVSREVGIEYWMKNGGVCEEEATVNFDGLVESAREKYRKVCVEFTQAWLKKSIERGGRG